MSKSRETFLLRVEKGMLVPDDGHTAARQANRARQARYRERNREKIRASARAYSAKKRAENPEAARASCRESYFKNRTKRNEKTKKWQRENADAWAESRRQYRAARKDDLSKSYAEWRAENPDKAMAARTRWRDRNADRIKEVRRRWYDRNKKRVFAAVAKRKADRAHRTPAWADLDAMRAIYEACPPGFHVDHIVPLRGRLVSGLHVETNLQYLPAKANIAKGNRYEV
jgi:hypothetical protein